MLINPSAFWLAPLGVLSLLGFSGLAAGGIFDAATGWATFAFSLSILVVYHLVYRALLLRWLQKPDPKQVPDGIGQWEEVFAALYRLIKNQRQSQESLSERLDSIRSAAAAMPDGIVILDAN